MKKLLVSLVSVILVGNLFACSSTEKTNGFETEKYSDLTEYKNLPKNNVFKELTEKGLMDFIDHGTGVLIFSFPECPWCQEANPVLNEIAKKEGVKTIYYFNPGQFRDSDSENYTKTKEKLAKFLEKDEQGNPRIYVPDVYVFDKGVATAHHIGTVDTHDAHERLMTAEERAQLVVFYEELLGNLK